MNRRQSERSRSSASADSSSPATTEPRRESPAISAQSNEPASLPAAVDALVYGYSTELQLYTTVRALTIRQRDTLCNGWNLERFGDLLDEKEDLLRMIGQVETAMKSAKSLVLSRKVLECPNRWLLDRLLDQVAAMIEEISAIERANASLLEGALAAG